jgi:hypothetical protein
LVRAEPEIPEWVLWIPLELISNIQQRTRITGKPSSVRATRISIARSGSSNSDPTRMGCCYPNRFFSAVRYQAKDTITSTTTVPIKTPVPSTHVEHQVRRCPSRATDTQRNGSRIPSGTNRKPRAV